MERSDSGNSIPCVDGLELNLVKNNCSGPVSSLICGMGKNYILNQEVAERKIRRMAYEILENNPTEPDLILAGIQENGIVLASQIRQLLSELCPIPLELLAISLDKKNPGEVQISKPLQAENKVIIVIDDVCNTGRTLLYALQPFLGSRPKKIQSLVLVERTHKAFPVKPDYVGLSVATTLLDHIHVEVSEGRVQGAWLE
jgi:pyrimidine operon attenuation protein / uracil phosphoribosyltransferase